jgi:hypothetical protein
MFASGNKIFAGNQLSDGLLRARDRSLCNMRLCIRLREDDEPQTKTA